MIPKNLFSTSSYLSVRSALFADNATNSSFQHLVQNALGTARQLVRGLFRYKSELPTEVIRKQHRLPVEFFKGHGGPRVVPKSNFISYRPGFIHRITSKWCINSLTNLQRRELLKRFYRGGSGPLIGFVGFALAKKPSLLTEEEELEGVSYLIRDSFSSLSWKGQGLNIDKNSYLSNISLANLKIGELIAKGCNAAIYSARLQEDDIEILEFEKQNCDLPNVHEDKTIPLGKNENLTNSKFFINSGNNSENVKSSKVFGQKTESKEIEEVSTICNSQFFIPHSEGDQSLNHGNNIRETDANLQTGTLSPFNVAVKVMFNYSAESNAFAIWNAMYKETLPSIGEFSFGDTWKQKVKKKKLKPHPNIVEMYSAFADQFPMLPGALNNYPSALPTRLQNDGCGRNMTLFLVMKRYHCCLKEYLQKHDITSETAILLFTQLLEGLVHLHQNGITHRDLKSDNILLDLSQGISSPRLAIADFGCCLENLSLPYTTYDIPKGGNMSLMAPEVVNTEPGPFSVIDYSRADLWAAGTIAYEIFGGSNPFYSNLKSCSYKEKGLPPLPAKAPAVIQNLVREILSADPKQRPSQNFAASICQTLLHAPSTLLVGTFDGKMRKRSLEWMFQLSSQTYLEVSVLKTEMLPVKLELCRTFCSRIQYLELLQALEYILKK